MLVRPLQSCIGFLRLEKFDFNFFLLQFFLFHYFSISHVPLAQHFEVCSQLKAVLNVNGKDSMAGDWKEGKDGKQSGNGKENEGRNRGVSCKHYIHLLQVVQLSLQAQKTQMLQHLLSFQQ